MLRIVADLLALGDEDVTALVVSHVLDIAPEIAAAAEVARCPDAQLCKVWPALLLQSHSLVRRHTRKQMLWRIQNTSPDTSTATLRGT